MGEPSMRVRPDAPPSRSLREIADPLGLTVRADAEISGVTLDSSDVRSGDLFAALPGSATHGARFAAEALASGAVAVLTDAEGLSSLDDDVPAVVVDDPREVLGEFAAVLYDHPSTAFTTVGITGTQGKTTSSYLAESAIGRESAAVIGTIGTRIRGVPAVSHLTTPEAPALQALFAVMREERVDACAMEVSSHALVRGRVDGFQFDVGVFLNLGRDHLDFHTDMDDYFAAKARLFTPEHAKTGVVLVDDDYGRRLTRTASVPVTTVSTTGGDADWRVVSTDSRPSGSRATLLGPGGERAELEVPLPGAFNVANAAAILVALLGQGYDLESLLAGIAACPGVPGRMERIDRGQEFTAVVDYAHKPDAVRAVLDTLRPVTEGRLIVVLGAGGDRDQGKRALMGEVAARHADVVVVTDDNPRSEDPAVIRTGVLAGTAGGSAEVIEVAGRGAAIAAAVQLAEPGDSVLVAGKGHEPEQEIDGVMYPFDDRVVLAECLEQSR